MTTQTTDVHELLSDGIRLTARKWEGGMTAAALTRDGDFGDCGHVS